MGYTYVVNELESHIPVFENLLNNKSKSEYLWRPKPEKWCLLEIVCHLYDEEREDFRARVKHTLEKPTEPLMPIDPVAWVIERDYISKHYNNTLEAFLAERKASVKWLKSLTSVDWEQGIIHPKLGMLSAKLFLTNWLAHDYLHIRQIIKYQFEYLKEKTEVELNYVGSW
jgi:hypothetical protein